MTAAMHAGWAAVGSVGQHVSSEAHAWLIIVLASTRTWAVHWLARLRSRYALLHTLALFATTVDSHDASWATGRLMQQSESWLHSGATTVPTPASTLVTLFEEHAKQRMSDASAAAEKTLIGDGA